MAHGIGEGRLFPPEDGIGQIVQAFEGVAEEIFALAPAVYLEGRIQGHHVGNEIQIPEGDSGLQRVDRNAAVRPEYVVHVELPDSLFGFCLEGFRRGSEIRIFVAEDLIRDLPGQKDPDVCLFMNGSADQIHAHGSPDGGDVIGAQKLNDPVQRGEDLLRSHIDLRMIGAYIVGRLPGVFEVDGVLFHADGKGADGLFGLPCRNGADQGRVQAAGKEKAYSGVGHQALFYAPDQLFPDLSAGCFQIVAADLLYRGDLRKWDKGSFFVVAAGRERQDAFCQSHQVFGLAGK